MFLQLYNYQKVRPTRKGGPIIGSATQAESGDDRAVALYVVLLQLVQETTTLAHEQQQTTTAVVVVLVLLEVFGEVGDAVAQERDLHLGGTGVALDGGVLGNDLLLGVCVSTNRHVELPIFRLVCAARRGLFTRALWSPRPLHGGGRP